jgi:hypothetical protein
MKSDSSKFSYFKDSRTKVEPKHGRVQVRCWFLSNQYRTLRPILSLNKPLNVEMIFVKI